ncbi:hypothetical protein HD598_002176 [Neomicrococcus aestuarii]|uniref:LamG-like jellyroll fold domain-containing protein n=1 Tax=Neomicrococcus aestuarii TaxID=556325 RepID=A0A7W8TV61_9MICC|nr:LamG-like jellyroll fold domain-containing protein [Neomicrococcus aestuarii]MBB5513489.1 hypothetical protein [Neomicrococcus aestuarii]
MQTPDKRLVTEEKLAAELAAFEPATGGGIEQVSGTVTLDSTGDPIREFYTTGATTFTANGTDTLISSYTAVVWRRTGAGSWGYQIVPESWTTPAATPDTTAPVAGTLAVDTTGTTATLTVTGASDDRGAVLYAFSKDGGTTYTGLQSDPTYTFTGLAPLTSYTWRHRVSDGTNLTLGAPVTKATPEYVPSGAYDDAVLADAPLYYWPLDDAAGSASVRNLGSGSQGTQTLTGVTLGAAGIGDGATSASFAGTSTSNKIALTGLAAPAMTASSMEMIISIGSGGQSIPILAQLTGSWNIKRYQGFTYQSGSTGYVSSGSLPGGRSHIAAVWTGTEAVFYVNGAEVARKAYTSTHNAFTGVGGEIGGGFAGRIAGVATYTTALAPARVLAHAQAAGLA